MGGRSPGPIGAAMTPEQFAVFGGVLPEDKYKLVKTFQKNATTLRRTSSGQLDLRVERNGVAILHQGVGRVT